MTTGQVAAAIAILVTVTAGCGTSEPDEPVDLVRPSSWEVGSLALDPQADHAPDPVDCAPGTYHVDGVPPFEGFEVTTGACNFMSAAQPILAPVQKGQTLRMVAWHLDLDATLPGPAHIAISIDREVLWETMVDVPSKANLYDVAVDAPRDFAAGTNAVFHVHNHGTNEWNMQSVRIEPD